MSEIVQQSRAVAEASKATERAEKHRIAALAQISQIAPNDYGLYTNRGEALRLFAAAREQLNNAIADLNRQPEKWPTSEDYQVIT